MITPREPREPLKLGEREKGMIGVRAVTAGSALRSFEPDPLFADSRWFNCGWALGELV